MAALLSRPARGGWIEIVDGLFTIPKYSCPAPHGAGGLKSYRLFVPV